MRVRADEQNRIWNEDPERYMRLVLDGSFDKVRPPRGPAGQSGK